MIYMLYDLQPSEELTGGPRYTDNELDIEFIELLRMHARRPQQERTQTKEQGCDTVQQTTTALGRGLEI
ncbi:hypothetical protein K466DRAFT_584713 [Polyporus arcularius HHB13444]|uniref:Uncharacterized protein n=1 Tax=Polyporus arcularius HHB13444 TaxID=1314778 RepID=A0A5C3PHU6_9APHY|nr:hypothetical protein K466DRAFT_584713 [Polyporus arcularius HHB13444]